MKYKDFYSDIKINEDPEIVLNQYPRGDYQSILFMGTNDAKGIIYMDIKNSPDMSHSQMLRRFVKEIDDDQNKVRIFGDVSSGAFEVEYSGVIIPKQNGIEKTLISLWDKKGLRLKQVLSGLMDLQNISLPAVIEITDMWNDKNTYATDF